MFKKIASFIFVLLTFACSNNNGPANILLLPKYVSIDSANQRLFVVDDSNNNLSLIDLATNKIVTEKPLINKDSALKIPSLPQDIVAVNLGNGVSRIFIIGANAPQNQISVLDYDNAAGLRSASFSTINVGTDTNSLLLGLALDSTNGNLFVSDNTHNQVRVYNIQDGTERAGSPINVSADPIRMQLNPSIQQLIVSSLSSTQITLINTQDFSVSNIEVGVQTSSAASATNANGTVLFTLAPTLNQINVFRLDLVALTATPIGSPILPPAVGQATPANNVLTGSAFEIIASPLADGRIGGFITQSTGDFGFVDVNADLGGFNQGLLTVINGSGAAGIDLLKDSSGNGLTAYYAAPGGSTVSYIDVVNNKFLGQIF